MKDSKHPYQWKDIVAQGEAGFAKLFEAYYILLFSIGYRMCGDRELVKDTIQSFFLYLWEKRFQLNHIQQLEAYLRTSFYRKMQEVLKERSKRIVNFKNISSPENTLSYETLLINSQEKEAKKKEIEKGLSQLSEQQKAMLELRFLEGLSYDEIAKKTGKSRQTIYNQIHSAVKKLRSILK